MPAAELPTTSLLDRVGKQVEAFWNYYPAVTCTETLSQTKLGEKGKVLFEQRSAYDYLILLQVRTNDLTVDESRVERNHKDSKAKASLLVTNGFFLMTAIFHPLYQSSYEFTKLPDDATSGRRLLRVGFRQIASDHAPSVLLLREREYPLLWEGAAWIDPDSYAIVRIQSGLGGSLADVGLLRLDTDVTFADVRFTGAPPIWLPARAVIEAATKRQHWRNTHLFADYHRFDVETEVKTAAPH